MTLLLLSFVAGILTVLAPCILPLLPVVIGSGVGARSRHTPYIVIASLGASILIFTYALKFSTIFIDIPPYVWTYISGGILILFGFVLAFPALWDRVPGVQRLSVQSNQVLGSGHTKKSWYGDVLVGAALGPVFSTCSPDVLCYLSYRITREFLGRYCVLIGVYSRAFDSATSDRALRAAVC